jgi:hypothetical protein
MKIRPLLFSACGLMAVVATVAVLSVAPSAGDAHAQSMAPAVVEECVCSRGSRLGESGQSVLHNCQCGPLQCVVHAQSGQLQCR